MRRATRLILRIACVTSIALGAVLLLHSARMVPPLGVGWGDGAAARAYSVELGGAIVFRTASGMKPAPPGNYTYGVQSLGRWDGAGVSCHRWNMTAGRTPSAPVLGTFAEVRIAPGWPLLISVVLASLCMMLLVKDRRSARRSGHHCRHCGYDLRATPDRCPECGAAALTQRVSAAPPA